MALPRLASLVPMAHVADIAASTAFYAALGFEVQASVTPPGGNAPNWVYLAGGGAQLMLNLATAPVVAADQAVLFYLYCEDVAAMHGAASAAGLSPGPIATPFYNPGGEFRLADPDGYTIFVAQI
jgi:catechol 2,3-dioxygenase-like lactoylglutathione lyase family enzyme